MNNSTSGTARDTIRAAAEAYLSGEAGVFSEQLHENVHVIGSEQLDEWSNRAETISGLEPELQRRSALPGSVSGSLIDLIQECEGVKEMGPVALWSGSGTLEIDGYQHHKATWTVVVRREGPGQEGEWKIAHSHFSIHR